MAGASTRPGRDSPSPAPSAESIGQVVRRLREARGESQKQVALAAGYAASSGGVTLSNIENGKALPKENKRDRLAEALDTTWDQIEAEARELDEQSGADRFDLSSAGSLMAIKRLILGQQKLDNEARLARYDTESSALHEQHREHVDRLSQSIARSREDFTDPLLALLSRIEGIDKDQRALVAHGEADADAAIDARIEANRVQISRSIVDMAGTTAALGAAGAGVGAAAAFATYSAVGAFATASTGAAIASLSGAAASSATLAWLGGGSLAAGGAGIAGGTAVLTGVLALPAVLAVLAAVVWQGHKVRKQSQQEAEVIAAAEQQLRDAEVVLRQAWDWATDITDITDRGTLEGVHRLAALTTITSKPQIFTVVGDGETGSNLHYDFIQDNAPEALPDSLSIAATLFALQALPIWSQVAELDREPDLAPGSGESGPAAANEATEPATGADDRVQLNASAIEWITVTIRASDQRLSDLAAKRRQRHK